MKEPSVPSPAAPRTGGLSAIAPRTSAPARPAGRLRVAALGACLLACLSGCREPARPNLVLIVVDTLRADHLGAWGYERPTSPHIDAFAADAVRFERAYAAAPWTKPSIASILTGAYPSRHGVQKVDAALSPRSDTLAEILSRVGYRSAAVVSHTLIGKLFGFGQGFETYRQDEARGHDHVSSDAVSRQAIELLSELDGGADPFFLFVHYFDPHFAYHRHPEYGFSSERAGRLDGGEAMATLRRLDPPPNPEEIAFLIDAYDEEIRHTDRAIGQLLRALEARGLYDQSVVVLTADHGEEFFERGWLGHTRTLYEEQIHVPLVIRLAEGRAAATVVSQPVSLVSLAPTVLDALGFDASLLEDLQESSLLGLVFGRDRDAPPPVYAEVDYDRVPKPELWTQRRSADMRVLIRGEDKLVHDRGPDQWELYDLGRDPGERENLAPYRPQRLRELQQIMEETSARIGAGGADPAPARPIDAQQARMLEELGYLDPQEEAGPAPDPDASPRSESGEEAEARGE
jgi:arylsulfatase